MVVSAQTYEQLALERPDERWELIDGKLRKKPAMTFAHTATIWTAFRELSRQINADLYTVDMGQMRLRVTGGSYVIPDVCVLPADAVHRLIARRPRELAVFDDPVALVVEVWSPSTGEYDVSAKLGYYRLRGDAEIWLAHPYERWLRVWRRQPDGVYSESLYRAGTVTPASLPDVTIDVGTLFAVE